MNTYWIFTLRMKSTTEHFMMDYCKIKSRHYSHYPPIWQKKKKNRSRDDLTLQSQIHVLTALSAELIDEIKNRSDGDIVLNNKINSLFVAQQVSAKINAVSIGTFMFTITGNIVNIFTRQLNISGGKVLINFTTPFVYRIPPLSSYQNISLCAVGERSGIQETAYIQFTENGSTPSVLTVPSMSGSPIMIRPFVITYSI